MSACRPVGHAGLGDRSGGRTRDCPADSGRALMACLNERTDSSNVFRMSVARGHGTFHSNTNYTAPSTVVVSRPRQHANGTRDHTWASVTTRGIGHFSGPPPPAAANRCRVIGHAPGHPVGAGQAPRPWCQASRFDKTSSTSRRPTQLCGPTVTERDFSPGCATGRSGSQRLGSPAAQRSGRPDPSAGEFRFDPIVSRGSASTWTDRCSVSALRRARARSRKIRVAV